VTLQQSQSWLIYSGTKAQLDPEREVCLQPGSSACVDRGGLASLASHRVQGRHCGVGFNLLRSLDVVLH
jgi:hypothetical protein